MLQVFGIWQRREADLVMGIGCAVADAEGLGPEEYIHHMPPPEETFLVLIPLDRMERGREERLMMLQKDPVRCHPEARMLLMFPVPVGNDGVSKQVDQHK